MKIILWRMAHNYLPTDDKLRKRTILTRYACFFCNRVETVEHCFFFCCYAKEIWAELKRYFHILLNLKGFINIRQWLLEWINAASDLHAMYFAVAIWHICDKEIT